MDHPELSDANYLLGALVQSGAAILAIVGGILGARYVSLHSEKNATGHELGKASARLARDELAAAGAAETHWVAHAKAWVLTPGHVRDTLEYAEYGDYEHYAYFAYYAYDMNEGGFGRESQDRYGTRCQKAVEHAQSLVSNLLNLKDHMTSEPFRSDFERSANQALPWSEARLLVDMPLTSNDRVNAALDAYRGHVRAAVERARNVDQVRALRQLARDLHGQWWDSLKVQSREAEESALAAESAWREAQSAVDKSQRLVDQHEARVETLFLGESLRLSAQMVAFLSFTVVIVPLVLMIPAWYEIPLLSKAAVVLLFLMGILALARYLWAYGSYLAGKTAMPASVWSLFWRLVKQPSA